MPTVRVPATVFGAVLLAFVVIPRTRDVEDVLGRVNVRPAQRAQLTHPQAGKERRHPQRALRRRERLHKRVSLGGRGDVLALAGPLRHLQVLARRVRDEVAPDGSVEDATERVDGVADRARLEVALGQVSTSR
jgi:hypothetical protein